MFESFLDYMSFNVRLYTFDIFDALNKYISKCHVWWGITWKYGCGVLKFFMFVKFFWILVNVRHYFWKQFKVGTNFHDPLWFTFWACASIISLFVPNLFHGIKQKQNILNKIDPSFSRKNNFSKHFYDWIVNLGKEGRMKAKLKAKKYETRHNFWCCGRKMETLPIYNKYSLWCKYF